MREKSVGRKQKSFGRFGTEKADLFPPVPDPFPVFFLASGRAFWKKGHYWKRIDSNVFGIEVVIRGQAQFVQNNRRYVVGPGQAYVLHRGASHEYSTGPAGILLKRYATFGGPGLDAILTCTGLDRVDVVDLGDTRPIVRLLKQADQLLQTRPAGFERAAAFLSYRIIMVVAIAARKPHSPHVNKAIDLIYQNADRGLSLNEIASHCGVSPSFIIRSFKNEMGTTPLHFHRQYRLDTARHFLTHSDDTIKEIAQRTGFEDQLHFSKAFRKCFGASPRQYRKRLEADWGDSA